MVSRDFGAIASKLFELETSRSTQKQARHARAVRRLFKVAAARLDETQRREIDAFLGSKGSEIPSLSTRLALRSHLLRLLAG